MEINILRKYILANKYEISLHAQKERCQEEISIFDIEQAILSGEIIENYPEDKRGVSYLIFGYSGNNAIHIVCTVLPNGWMRIITVYIPKIPKWINSRQRRR